VDVGQLEGGIGTGEVWAHADDMGTLGQQEHGKGSVSTGSGNFANVGQVVDVFRKVTGPEEPGNLGENFHTMDREVTHAIPTTE